MSYVLCQGLIYFGVVVVYTLPAEGSCKPAVSHVRVGRSDHLPQFVASTSTESSTLSSSLYSQPDNLTQVWKIFDAFFETDFSPPPNRNMSTETADATTDATRRFSQSIQAELFHMDVGDCSQSSRKEFRAWRGVVTGATGITSRNSTLFGRQPSCYWTVVVPKGRYVSAAVRTGPSLKGAECNVLCSYCHVCIALHIHKCTAVPYGL